MAMISVQCGLDRLRDENFESLRGRRIGVCCNRSAIDGHGTRLEEWLVAAGIEVVRWFEPEHGIAATAQDMETVVSNRPEVISLYGADEASLRPASSTLEDLDLLLFDIQDIGSRYYTFGATLRYILEVAALTGTRVMVLDRPNPIGGIAVEGGTVHQGFESFVGASPISIRHGLTMGELALLLVGPLGIDADLQVIPCQGWSREMLQPDGPLPWVAPSPNMPTAETALIYPGICLVEGTVLSEGRGTDAPFHRVGAPWIDADRLAETMKLRSKQMGLLGVSFSPVHFVPEFQKFARQQCHGIEIKVIDASAVDALLLGVITLEQARAQDPELFRWRTDRYEFIEDPLAIDLLWGGDDLRLGLEQGISPRDLIWAREEERCQFLALRQEILLY
ncbi:MAG: DUF1343 domain-containing protein [Planctomycetota bacterium]|nr:DUF1343 domain-containing protein [Planctomycetota bacterium]